MKPCLNSGDAPQPLYRQEPMELEYPEAPNTHRSAYQEMKRDQRTNLRGFESEDEFYQFAQRYMDKAFMMEQAKIASSNIKRVSNLGNLIAQYSPAILSPKSPARQLRDWLVDAQAAGRNLFDTAEFWARDMGEHVARFHFTKNIDQSYEDFINVAKRHSLTKDQLDRLWLDMNELGNRKRLTRFNGYNEFSYKAQQRKYSRMIEHAKELGFNDDEIKAMARATEKHTGVYDVMRGVGNTAGTDIAGTEGLRYIPRLMTDDTSYIMRRAAMRDQGLSFKDASRLSLENARMKSRETFEFYVDDVVMYADAVGHKFPEPPKRVKNAVESTRQDAAEYAEKVRNRPPGRSDAQHAQMEKRLEQLQRKADEANAKLQQFEDEALGAVASHFTDERKLIDDIMHKMSEGDLDRLVDNGVIGKAPMTNTQIYDLLKQKYGREMPFRGIADMVEVDPHRSFAKYKNQMREALGASQVVNEIHVNGVEFGLAVPKAAFDEAPNNYTGWKPLGQLTEKYGLQISNKSAVDTRVHPYVYDQLDALFKLSTEPAAQSAVARFIQATTQFAKRGVLGTFEFVNRNMVEVALQSWRAGTNLATLLPASQYYSDFIHHGAEALPDEKLFGGGRYSVRDIMEHLVQSGRMSLSSPVDGVALKKSARTPTEKLAEIYKHHAHPDKALNLKNLQPFAERLMAQARAEGMLGGARWVARGFNRAQTEWFTNLLMPLAHAQDAAILANMMTTLGDGRWNRVGQFFSTGSAAKFHFDEMVDASRHVDEYIYRYQTGLLDRQIKLIVPFWSYMSNAMPATLRGMARNPSQYLAYQRLYAAINGDARQDEDFTEAAVPPWFTGQMPIVFRDPEGRDDMWFSVDMSRIDPVFDLLNRASRTSDQLGRLRGSTPGSYLDQIEQVGGLDSGSNWFTTLVGNNASPLIQTALAAYTQVHPFFEREFSDTETVFGQEVLRGEGVWSGGYQRYLLDSWLPQVRWIEKQLALAMPETFAPTIIDANGNESLDPKYTNALVRGLNALGFTTTTIDEQRGLQRTEANMIRISYELQDKVRMLEGRANKELDPEKRLEMFKEAARLEALRTQVLQTAEAAEQANREKGRMTHGERQDERERQSAENAGESASPEQPVQLPTNF